MHRITHIQENHRRHSQQSYSYAQLSPLPAAELSRKNVQLREEAHLDGRKNKIRHVSQLLMFDHTTTKFYP
jgi:hypothetical protein